ncbi:MAG: N-6 DNA methylase [Candidatus Cloacimonadaceae bacterium]
MNSSPKFSKINNTKRWNEGYIIHQKHFSTADLPDNLKSNIGKYYTPPSLVKLVGQLVGNYLRPDAVIMDLAAGCGAFLDLFPNHKMIIRDIDSDAVQFLRACGYSSAQTDNSLANVNRSKYGLNKDDYLVCIGNPPYNDLTSLVKRKGTNAKKDIDFEIDEDIRSGDLGTSFLRAFAKLDADVICVLHPLSYLIKEANFKNRLKNFTMEYILQEGVIFSSEEFSDTGGSPFPIVAALYLRHWRGMDYDYIKNFPFKIKDTNELFVLSTYETIDGYIRKYASPGNWNQLSDIGLYMHNFRDLNSLKAVGNLTDKPIPGVTIPVNANEFYKYAYINSLRRYFPKNFRWGNLSPLVIRNQLEHDIYLQDACIIDTIIANQRLTCLSVKVNSPFLQNLAGAFQNRIYPAGYPDIYTIFNQFYINGSKHFSALYNFLKQYFENLPNLMEQKVQDRKE